LINPRVAVAEARADIAAIKILSSRILCIEVGRWCCSGQVEAACELAMLKKMCEILRRET